MVLSGQKRSKVLPRRHVSSIPMLLHHSQRLHHAFAALEREENRAQRRLSLNAQPSRRNAGHSTSAATTAAAVSTIAAVTTTAAAAAKPLVFRKTKREIERERALQTQQQQCAKQQQQQLDDIAASILASCMRPALAKLRPTTCRVEFLRDATSLRIGARGRSRRRLVF